MSGVDRAWLLMERPASPMLVVVLIVLSAAVRRERLRRLLAERFLCFPRFRCLPVNETVGGRWVEATQFDLDDHIQCVSLPAGAGQPELEALVGELASTALNPSRPLWSFHLVAGYGAGSALIVRIHHCYADGVALLQVLLSLCGRNSRGRGAAKPSRSGAPEDSATSDTGSIGAVLRGGADLLERGLHYGLHPLEAGAAARPLVDFSAELARLGLMPDEPVTRLKHPLSGIKRAAWAQSLALEEVHVIGRVLGCTVNDVLVSVLAGALGRYLAAQGEDVTGLTLRAVVPVNLRTASSTAPSLGNDFGLVFVELPVGIRHPLERLYAVRSVMQHLKASPQALITLGLLATVGSLPASIEELVLAQLGAKASLVASNLPGPNQRLRLAGATVSQVLFWVPQAGGIGTGVSMLTYCGRVQLGVIADRELIARPAELVEAMTSEFERLVFLVLLGAGSLAG